MGLFGKKKATVQPVGQVPFNLNAPGQMSAPKGTLAQNLGLDSDLGKLPPLPGLDMKDSAPNYMNDLPPLPPSVKTPSSSKLGDLPPLPDDTLPPLPKGFGSIPSGPAPLPLGPPSGQPTLPALPPIGAKKVKPTTPESAPVFIRLDKYQEIINTVNQMESRINNLQNAIKKIGDIKAKEQDIINNWTSLLTEARQKVNSVNSRLPETK